MYLINICGPPKQLFTTILILTYSKPTKFSTLNGSNVLSCQTITKTELYYATEIPKCFQVFVKQQLACTETLIIAKNEKQDMAVVTVGLSIKVQ